jgi:mannose-6-phosphate isomerase
MDRASRQLTAAIQGLQKFFITEPSGIWHEVMRGDGTLTAEPCKASSFYHIVSAIQTVERTLRAAPPRPGD